MKLKETITYSVTKSMSSKWMKVMWTILICAILSWTVFSFMQLMVDSAVVINNSDTVLSDSKAIKVEDIEEDGTLRLADTTSVLNNDISEYTRTAWGTGSYYIPDGIMSASLTLQDSIMYAARYVILAWVSFGMLLFMFSRCKRLLSLNLYTLLQVVFVLCDMFVMYMYSTLYYYKNESIANNVLYVFLALALVRLAIVVIFNRQYAKKIRLYKEVLK